MIRLISFQKSLCALVSFDTSQETSAVVTKELFVSTKKGNRPSFTHSARPEVALSLL
jgi:hypothetical protein